MPKDKPASQPIFIMSSYLSIRRSLGSLVQTSVKRTAAYSTEANTSSVDISSFLARVKAISSGAANENGKKTGKVGAPNQRSSKKFKYKSMERVPFNRAEQNSQEVNLQSSKSNNRNYTNNQNNRNNRNNSNNRPAQSVNSTIKQATPESKPETYTFAKATRTPNRYSDFDASSVLADTSFEKVDLHVSSEGSKLFRNKNKNDFRPQSSFNKRPNNNFNRRNSAFFQKKGSPRFNRDRKSALPVKKVDSSTLTPEQALAAVRKQMAVKGSLVIDAVTPESVKAYSPGLAYSNQSRVLLAINKAKSASSNELKSIIDSTLKGTLSGYQIPVSTKANGQEFIIPVLNNNSSYEPALKNFYLKLASGQTSISTLRK